MSDSNDIKAEVIAVFPDKVKISQETKLAGAVFMRLPRWG